MKRSRKNNSSKFKTGIALEALRGDATLAELSSRHGAHANQITSWRKQRLEHAGEVFENGRPAADDAERRIRDLQTKVGELIMDAIFCQGTRSLRPAERKTLIDRESEMTIKRQCKLLDLCRSSLYYRSGKQSLELPHFV